MWRWDWEEGGCGNRRSRRREIGRRLAPFFGRASSLSFYPTSFGFFGFAPRAERRGVRLVCMCGTEESDSDQSGNRAGARSARGLGHEGGKALLLG